MSKKSGERAARGASGDRAGERSGHRNSRVHILPIYVAGDIGAGDSLSEILFAAARRLGFRFLAGDVLVVKHKIVSKAEGGTVALAEVRPSASARAWGRRYGVDARVHELALRESRRIVRRERGVLITETRHGLICANSGVDVSNVDGGRHAVLLPADADRSAARLRQELKARAGVEIAVIVSDSFGRPWREGLTEVAIGVAGMRPLIDYRGRRDAHGHSLHSTIEAVADELACAAGLVCGKLERTPACIIRGYAYRRGNGRAREMLRPAGRDLFR